MGYRSSFADRRVLIKHGLLAGAGLVLGRPTRLTAQGLRELDIASAGSVRSVLEGPLQAKAAEHLHLDLRIHAGGADAIARSILDGSVPADVFLSVTAAPMRTLITAGRAKTAVPFASTEMVILYSPKSRFATQFQDAAEGKRNWWEVLGEPGLKFARSNPADDPSGRSILFTVMLAGERYNQPALAHRLLGDPLNAQQVRPGTDVRKGLETGTIDAAGSYRIATRLGTIPYVSLPSEINLSDPQVREKHPQLSLQVGDKTFYPEPLVFYAAVLQGAKSPADARAFVDWLTGKQAADVLAANGFATAAGYAAL